jgi:hypothetical protein
MWQFGSETMQVDQVEMKFIQVEIYPSLNLSKLSQPRDVCRSKGGRNSTKKESSLKMGRPEAKMNN